MLYKLMIAAAILLALTMGSGCDATMNPAAGTDIGDTIATIFQQGQGDSDAAELDHFGQLPGETYQAAGYAAFEGSSADGAVTCDTTGVDSYDVDVRVEVPTCPLDEDGCYGIFYISGTINGSPVSPDGDLSWYLDELHIYEDGSVEAMAEAGRGDDVVTITLSGYFDGTEDGVQALNGEYTVTFGMTTKLTGYLGRAQW